MTDQIIQHCLQSTLADPIALLDQLMDLDGVPMHSPIHHFLVPAALLSAWHRQNGTTERLAADLQTAAERAAIVPAGHCSRFGACGAALGAGAMANIAVGHSNTNWSLVMQLTSHCGLQIAKHGGPRCCKRDSYLAIICAVQHLERLFGIRLSASQPRCHHSGRNNQCRGQECLFFWDQTKK